MINLTASARTGEAIFNCSAHENILSLSVCGKSFYIDFSQLTYNNKFVLTDTTLAYNPIQSAVFNEETNQIDISCFFDDAYTNENPSPEYAHLTDTYSFVSTLSEYKERKIEEVSDITKANIYKAYSPEAQMDAQSDYNYALSVLAFDLKNTQDYFMGIIVTWIVTSGNSELFLKRNYKTMNLDDLYVLCGVIKDNHKTYVKKCILGIVTYRLIRFGREWYAAKANDIQIAKTRNAVDNVILTDFPEIA